MNAPRTPPPIVRRAPRTDILDLRDLAEVVAAPSASGTIVCLAGCDGNARSMAAAPAKPDVGVLALVGPIESVSALKSVSLPVTAAAATDAEARSMVICLAGCDDSDRKVMRATGAPLPVGPQKPPQASRPVTAETARAKAAALATPPEQPASLKRSIAPHARAIPAKSKGSLARTTARRTLTVASHTASGPARRPVRVETSGAWFGAINRAHAARKVDLVAQ